MITIYGDKRSGNCLKVLYTADKLGIPHDWVDIDIMKGETRAPEFLIRNPAGQIPVMELEDGRCLAQSNAIVMYLAQGSELIPGDPWHQARVWEWLFWEQYSHEPSIAVCRFQKLFLNKRDDELDPDRVKKGNRALDLMEDHLSEHDWLVAESLSVADVSLVAYTRLAHEGGFDLGNRPAVRTWVSNVEHGLGI